MPRVTEEQIIKTGEDPDVFFLQEQYRSTQHRLGSIIDQHRLNFDTRMCLWANQSDDGRKHAAPNTDVFPWDGASDIRPFAVNNIIDQNVAMLVNSLMSSNLVAIPVEAGDTKRARLVTSFMKWLMFSQMPELPRQAEILANYYEEKGQGFIGAFWQTTVTNIEKEITIDEFASIAPDFLLLLQDKEAVDTAVDVLGEFFPDLTRRELKRMIGELRDEGRTSFPQEKVTINRPVIQAYALDEDFFLPVNTRDIQRSPWVFKAEYYQPEELREKVTSEGWDEAWVEAAIDTAGMDQLDDINSNQRQNITTRDDVFGFEQNERYVRVICAYHKAVNENGIPGIYLTIFHDNLPGFAHHQLWDYEPARYPFVPFAREMRSQRLLDSRGLPELLKPFQDELKVQLDSVFDRTTLSTCPPREHPVGRKPSNWGPGESLAVRRRGEYGFVEIPAWDGVAPEVIADVQMRMKQHSARPTSELDATDAQVLRQHQVNRWLNSWKEVFEHCWLLHQQYGSEVEVFRVIGTQSAEPMRFEKSGQHEKYDFYLDYNVLNADADLMLKKVQTMGEMFAQFDRTGQADWGEFIQFAATAIDPVMAERLVMPRETATVQEIESTQNDMAKIASGQHVNAPLGANAELRIQVVQGYLNGTEEIPAIDVQQRYQEDEAFRARIDNYLQQLQQQIQQQQNAVTGRLGAPPGNSVPTSV